jgi:hypothetical protein
MDGSKKFRLGGIAFACSSNYSNFLQDRLKVFEDHSLGKLAHAAMRR